MKQDAFVAAHQSDWSALDAWLIARSQPKAKDRSFDAEGLLSDVDFPAAYRRVCHHLALAERRGYSTLLIDYLRELIQRGHQVLYRPSAPRWHRIALFLGAEFPRLVRSQWRVMAVSAALLFVPFLLTIGLIQWRPDLAQSLFEPAQLAQFENMYDPANSGRRLGRTEGTDVKMFGYYIMNNVSIGFRTFASGLVAGVGSVLVLVSNGIIMGGVAGHLTAIGYGGPFWRFVVGHSAPELLAIVIAGGAGLQLGMAILAPGRRTRGRALVEAGVIGARLALGVFAMLVFAAFVEAFWSSIEWMPDPVKFSVGGLLWLFILLWLVRGGREHAHGG
ncbi:stage II sporulation protein M [Tahibacter amnicola]|uniref:Stage II sporulation protein M n=1 Tax=Tahibacter amnicola TaxID=2976241 RepID=A0ABY6BDC5_9GAMM|nr:stage II sporulation protein M [Tahibacter amnicola]UXI68033.1 stage II sporulation protein M [Tahibacter amnicola]